MVALLLVLVISPISSMVADATSDDMRLVYLQVPDGWDSPSVWAWDDDGTGVFDAWPGGEAMPDPANEGWYYIYLPAWANNIIVNANGGEIQTEDYTLEDGDVWITVISEDEVEISYEQLTVGDAPPFVPGAYEELEDVEDVNDEADDTPMVTIHVIAPEDWDTPSLWAWTHPDGINVFPAWPGEPLVQSGDWLVLSVPSWVNRVIVNGNNGEVQTADIDVDEGRDVWLVVTDADNYTLTYEEPELATIAPISAENDGNNIVLIIVICAIIVVGIIAFVIIKKRSGRVA